MPQISTVCLFAIALAVTGCSGSNGLTVGSSQDADPNGSYAGSTLNSPTTDQNPHVGGDPSYPASVSDQGVMPPPPEKADGR